MPRSARKAPTGSLIVSGPFEEDHPVDNVGQGMVCASQWCSKHRHHEEELTYYVRDLITGRAVARATKLVDGTILIHRTEGRPANAA